MTSDPAGQPEITVPEFPTKTLWHYTNTAGLLGILGILGNVDKEAEDGKPRSGTYKPVFHASAAQFLNDQRELTMGLGVVKDFLDIYIERQILDHQPDAKVFLSEVSMAIQQIVDKTYPDYLHCSTISFSTHEDSLSQWRAYGRGTGGFAIGFEPSMFPRSTTADRVNGMGLQKVTYTSHTAGSPLLDVFNAFVAQAIFDTPAGMPSQAAISKAVQRLALAAASVKHAGFSEEREWRFVEPGVGHQRGETNDPDFKDGAAGLVPYLKVPLLAEAVVGLRVGPGPYQYENYLAAKSMLRRYGYVVASHNVHRSDTPFR